MPGLRDRIHEIIFEAETPAGKAFDVALLVAIGLSIVLVSLESVESIGERWAAELHLAEWILTLLFTVEYVLRLVSVRRPLRYARSFFGVIDLLAILPTYLSLFVAGTHALVVIRALRLLRAFRVLKLAQFVGEASVLRSALLASANKIIVFLCTVLAVVVIIGAVMYLVEQDNEGFSSIPQSVYWAIVTLTTVGYGDAAPVTPLGKALASVVMIMGYGVLAVPTGIVSVELASAQRRDAGTRSCPDCGEGGHDRAAAFCKACGGRLDPP